MTDELKQKCTEQAKIFQQAMKSCHSSNPMDCIEWFADRIVELEQQINKMKCCGNCDHYRWSNGEDWCNDHYGQPMYDEECKGKWKLRR